MSVGQVWEDHPAKQNVPRLCALEVRTESGKRSKHRPLLSCATHMSGEKLLRARAASGIEMVYVKSAPIYSERGAQVYLTIERAFL